MQPLHHERQKRHLTPRICSLILCALVLLVGCTDQQPIKIGFIGGLTGRFADLGQPGRNGAILAIEEQNARGGIDRQRIQLIVKDHQQDIEQARAQVTNLIDQGVAAIIGPLTSSMAEATVPLANERQVVMISPCATTEALTGIDDYFFRVVASTGQYAEHHAYHLHDNLNLKKFTVIYDLSNKSFAESYYHDFRTSIERLGGEIVQTETFQSGPSQSFFELASKAVSNETDGILIIASAMDTALLSQQLKKIRQDIKIATSEWSATEKLIELGGVAVEGVLFHQFFNRDSTYPAYLKFRQAYVERFGEEPGFASVASYDAAMIAIEALKQRNGRTVKETLISISKFTGSQGDVIIDKFGDTSRPAFLSTIRDGRFVILEPVDKHRESSID